MIYEHTTFFFQAAAKQQKEKLVDTTRCWYYMRYYITCFEDLCQTGHFVNAELVKNTEKFLVNVTITMAQCRILLETCPQQPVSADDIIQIPIITPRDVQFDFYKNDSKWNQISSTITDILNLTSKLQSVLQKLNKCVPSVEKELITPKYVFIQETDIILKSFNEMIIKLHEIQSCFVNVDSLNWLEEIVMTLKMRYENIREDTVDLDKSVLDKLMEKVLVAIQNIYKKYSAIEKQNNESEDAYVINENHFRGLILQNLNDDLACLQFKDVFKMLHKTSAKLMTINPNIKAKNTILLVIPLLEQLSLLYQYYITQQVSSYRITCKLTSVLLNIFINLVSKVSIIKEKKRNG